MERGRHRITKIFPVEEERWEWTKRKVGHCFVVARGWREIYAPGGILDSLRPAHVVCATSNSGERCWTNERRTKEDTNAKGGQEGTRRMNRYVPCTKYCARIDRVHAGNPRVRDPSPPRD